MIPVIVALGMIAYGMSQEDKPKKIARKMARGGRVGSTKIFDLEYGDVFEVTKKNHLSSNKKYVFIGLDDKYNVSIKAKQFPDHVKEKNKEIYITDVSDGDIKILGRKEAGDLLMKEYTRLEEFEKGGSVEASIKSESDFKNRFAKLVKASIKNDTKQKLDEYLEDYGIEVGDEEDVKYSDWDVFDVSELNDIYTESKHIVNGKNDNHKMAKGGKVANGKVIGHTKSGKPVFANKEATHQDYKNFTNQDHKDAAELHDKKVDYYESKMSNSRLARFSPANEKAEHHYNISEQHKKQSNKSNISKNSDNNSRGEFGSFVYEIWDDGILKKEKIVRAGYKNLVLEMAKDDAKNIKHTHIDIRKLTKK